MKKFSFLLMGLFLILIFTAANKRPGRLSSGNMNDHTYTYLAIGDSYTIGESVLLTDNFPYQTVQFLRKSGFSFNAPEIIAKTGWTTEELQAAIDKHKFLPGYDFVTLLIGVNNQYRGRSVENYIPEFEKLLKQAIDFAIGKNDHVIVVSIPDWGVTPFAEGRDRSQIGQEIDAYNKANRTIAEKYNVNYIDITPGSREARVNKKLVADDGLHPSALEYNRWAGLIVAIIKTKLAN